MLILGLILGLAVGLIASAVTQLLLTKRVTKLERALALLIMEYFTGQKAKVNKFTMGGLPDDPTKH